MSFVFALVAAWMIGLFGESSQQVRFIFGATFYGLYFFCHVKGVVSWENLDDIRWGYNDKSQVKALNAVYYLHPDVKKMLASGILNYLGLYLVSLVVMGNFKFRFNLAFITYAAAVALNIIGIIILWNLDAVGHLSGNIEDDDTISAVGYINKTVRDLVFNIAVPQVALLFMLAGSVFFDRVDGALCAAVFVGLYGLWYLSSGFYIKAAIESAYPQSQVDKAWAGSLFCWFSSWTSVVCCIFAFRANAEGIAA